MTHVQTSTTASTKPTMLTIPQLEAMQILPGRAIRRLIAENKISSVKVGNRRYINLAVFERYLNGEQGTEQLPERIGG